MVQKTCAATEAWFPLELDCLIVNHAMLHLFLDDRRSCCEAVEGMISSHSGRVLGESNVSNLMKGLSRYSLASAAQMAAAELTLHWEKHHLG